MNNRQSNGNVRSEEDFLIVNKTDLVTASDVARVLSGEKPVYPVNAA